MLVRQDITEGNAGAPLILNITVIDTNTCQPIVGAAVDIWHCNSLGVYSAFEVEGTKGETYLRGIQFTDNNDIASFKTIYPGWYVGRVTHIHIKVHINSTLNNSSGTIIGGHTSHTGQIYFNDTTDNEVAKLAPYSDRESVPRTPQNSDSIFVRQGGVESLLDIQFIDNSVKYSGGFVASVVLGVDSKSAASAMELSWIVLCFGIFLRVQVFVL
jgi:protocatechuate 3,4-dioxygenase beta subunit